MPWGGSLECGGEIGQVVQLAANGRPPASVDSKVLGTWMLMVGKAILDTWNKGAPAGLEPVVVGLLILAITLSMGANCELPINLPRTSAHGFSPT